MYDAVDLAGRECFRSFAALPNARLIDEAGAFGAATDVPLTFFNGIATAREPDVPAVIDIFRRRGRAFRWWVRDSLAAELRAHGMRHRWDTPGMIADLARIGRAEAPPELRIVRVTNLELLAEWAWVLTSVFRTGSDYETWIAAFGALGFDGAWSHFVGYLDDEPVSTTSLMVSGDVAGIYHVGTLESARGRGIGSAVTRAALLHARERGAKEAALQSSDMAVNVYRGLGFADAGTLAMYEWTPEPASVADGAAPVHAAIQDARGGGEPDAR